MQSTRCRRRQLQKRGQASGLHRRPSLRATTAAQRYGVFRVLSRTPKLAFLHDGCKGSQLTFGYSLVLMPLTIYLAQHSDTHGRHEIVSTAPAATRLSASPITQRILLHFVRFSSVHDSMSQIGLALLLFLIYEYRRGMSQTTAIDHRPTIDQNENEHRYKTPYSYNRAISQKKWPNQLNKNVQKGVVSIVTQSMQ